MKIESNNRKNKIIWWIWTWVMWESMAKHILKSWYELYVYNRTESKTKELVSMWAIFCNNIVDLVSKSDIIISIIWDPKSVEDLFLWEDWIINKWRKGQIFIDMTTTKPSLSKIIFEKCLEKWIKFLDSPVSWWDIWARNGTLAIMVWWEEEVFNDNLELLNLMWTNVVYEWMAWAGQSTKMCNQIAIAWTLIWMCESLVYWIKVWLDLEKVMKVISTWAGGSWSIENLSPRIIRWELDTWFYVKHFVKDMKIALEEAKNMDLELPWLKLVNELYSSLVAQWWENLWTQWLIKVLKWMNNIE